MTDFGAQLLATLTGGAMTMMISIGHRTGLFEAAARGPATSAELAERAGLRERYVREWLGAMVTGGIFEHKDGVYTLPSEHAAMLTGDTATNVAPMASMLRALGGTLPELERAFVEGGGVPHAAFRPHFEAAGTAPGAAWRYIYEDQLVDGFFGVVPGLVERLRSGAAVLDLGCGTGHAVRVAARAFPQSEFTGLDIDPGGIEAARAEAADLPNARYVVGDAAELAGSYDVIMAFDAIHDQSKPDEVLRRVRAALKPGGVFVMVDTKFSSDVAKNVANPYAPLCYATSLLYCVTASLAQDGAALGAMWGTELAERMLGEAGFSEVTVVDSPRPQNCVFVCR